jgi:putative ABC transport system ATP-binding protein
MSDDGEVLVRLDRVSRVYQDPPAEVVALAETTVDIPARRLVVVMGPSGSGKSTLLSLIGGLDVPTSGTITVLGRDVGALSPVEQAMLRRRVVGYVFQDLNLLPGLTAEENVALPLELDGASSRSAAKAARAALAGVGLALRAARFPAQLSGGEQQRVAVARALVGGRRIILADEPTGSLDSVTGAMVVDLLRRFCDAGGSCVMVTHNPAHAEVADLVIRLRDGVVVEITDRRAVAAMSDDARFSAEEPE